MEVVRHVWRDYPDDLLLHRTNITAAMVELDPVSFGRSRPGRESDGLLNERRSHHREAVGLVNVILDHLVVESDDPHQRGVHPKGRGHTGRAEPRQVHLRLNVEPQGNHLADMHAEETGGAGGHHDLVRPLRVCQPSLRGREAVLREELPVETAHRDHSLRCAEPRGAIGSKRYERRCDEARHPFHSGQMCDLGSQRRTWTAVGGGVVHRHAQIRRVGPGQEGRVRRLRPPGAGDRGHGQATHQADEEDEREVSGPPAMKGGTEPVPGKSHTVLTRPEFSTFPPAPSHPSVVHARPVAKGGSIRMAFVPAPRFRSTGALARRHATATRPGLFVSSRPR